MPSYLFIYLVIFGIYGFSVLTTWPYKNFNMLLDSCFLKWTETIYICDFLSITYFRKLIIII